MTDSDARAPADPAFLEAVLAAAAAAGSSDFAPRLAEACSELARFAPNGRLGFAAGSPETGLELLAAPETPVAGPVSVLAAGDPLFAELLRGAAVRLIPGRGRTASDHAAVQGLPPLLLTPVVADDVLRGAFVLVDGGPKNAEAVERVWPAAGRLVAMAVARGEERRNEAARTLALIETEKLAALGRLMAGVVHELGGPLQSIISLADVLERDPERDDRLEASRRILRSALRCRQIAQELLSFARRNPSRRVRLDPRAAILDALELDRFAAAGDVDFRFDESAPAPAVAGDPQRLAQVVLNLLSNARAATADLDVREPLRVTLETVPGAESRLKAPQAAQVVRIAVMDRGHGVPAPMCERIFEPFVTTKADGRGTGLGLHVSRQMTEEAGGVLYLDRDFSPGARFVVELPAAGTSLPVPEPAPESPETTSPPGLRVLAIDDDRDVLETYQVVLALERHSVVACDRATAALEACRAEDFDAILCDVRLPDMDGRAFVEALARMKPYMAERVVFATGDVTDPETQALLAATPRPSLQKPFRIEELEAALRAVAPNR